MSLELIGVDWNGTLIDQADEAPLFEYIGMKLLSRSLPKSLALRLAKHDEYRKMVETAREFDGFRWRFHPLQALELAKTKTKLKEMRDKYRGRFGDKLTGEQRELLIREMYSIYNEGVIDGLPVDFIDNVVIEYVDTIASKKIHEQTLSALGDFRSSRKLTPMTIISSGYEDGIKRTLISKDLSIFIFDKIIGNGLDVDGGVAKGFKLDIYNNKDAILKNMLDKYHANSKNAAYIGDDPYTDGPVMAMVGRPIVSLLATNDDRQAMSLKYKARTPHTRKEFLHDLETD